jgi:multidrug resistance protein
MDERVTTGRDNALEDEHRQEKIPNISPCTTSNLDNEIRTDSHSDLNNHRTNRSYEGSDDTLHEKSPDEDSILAQNHDRIPSQIIISFASTDPDAPNNWPFHKKFVIFLGGIMSVINSTLASSMPSGASQEIAKHFHVTSDLQLVLPISTFLIGYVVGPILCGPLSENYGRKIVFLVAFLLYTIFTMATALAPNWPAFLIFRFICGVFASAPVAVVGGLYADIFADPRKRGVAMACFMAATTFGPVLGPLISGFTAPVSWRWPFWILLMLAGVTIPFILIMPESYAPVILARKAARMRQETGNKNIVARKDLESRSMNYVITMVMTRPFRMLFHESIVLFTCMYLSLAYAIFYLYFEAYPIIFQGPNSVYHFNAGETGLVGTLILSFSRRNQPGRILFMFNADLDFAGIPADWHWCGSMFAAFPSLRLIPGAGAGEKGTLEPDRGIQTPATGLRRRSIICGLAFLDRLVCKG